MAVYQPVVQAVIMRVIILNCFNISMILSSCASVGTIKSVFDTSQALYFMFQIRDSRRFRKIAKCDY
jgi:hypothetical protein